MGTLAFSALGTAVIALICYLAVLKFEGPRVLRPHKDYFWGIQVVRPYGRIVIKEAVEKWWWPSPFMKTAFVSNFYLLEPEPSERELTAWFESVTEEYERTRGD